MKKSNIRVFGETSISHVEKRGLFSYAVVRDYDKKVLAKSFSFRKYMNDTIRTMYTGEHYATGDGRVDAHCRTAEQQQSGIRLPEDNPHRSGSLPAHSSLLVTDSHHRSTLPCNKHHNRYRYGVLRKRIGIPRVLVVR